jgi:hypothetical protein
MTSTLRTLGYWVRIPLGHRFVLGFSVFLSPCVPTGRLPIQESYRVSVSRKPKSYNKIYLSIYLSIYDSAVLLLDLGRFSSFLIIYTDGRTPWTGDQPVARPLPTHKTTQTQNKRTQTSVPWVEFEPTIPVFQQAKTVRALDRAATVNG